MAVFVYSAVHRSVIKVDLDPRDPTPGTEVLGDPQWHNTGPYTDFRAWDAMGPVSAHGGAILFNEGKVSGRESTWDTVPPAVNEDFVSADPWDHILGGRGKPDLLYNRATGHFAVGWNPIKHRGAISAGWSRLAWVGSYLLAYNDTKQTWAVYRVLTDAPWLAEVQQPKPNHIMKRYDHMSSVGSLVLFLDAQTGVGKVSAVDSAGVYRKIVEYSDFSTWDWMCTDERLVYFGSASRQTLTAGRLSEAGYADLFSSDLTGSALRLQDFKWGQILACAAPPRPGGG